MVETTVIFLVGALAAGVLGLLLVPVFARRAARLAEARVRATMPLSMAEIQAQKDVLRAEFAVQLRKVEVEVERVRAEAAERQIALGRGEARIAELGAEVKGHKTHIGELDARVDDLKATIAGLEKQITERAAALRERQQALESANAAARAAEGERDEATALADTRKVENVALKTQIDNLEDRIADLRSELAVKSVAAEERAAESQDHQDEMKRQGRLTDWLRGRIERRRQLAAARRRQVAELRSRIALGRTELATRSLALEARHEQEGAMAALAEERDALRQALTETETRLGARDEEAERLRAEVAGLRGAARRDWHDPEAERLRESIGELAGRLVVHGAASGDDEIRRLIDAVSAVRGAGADAEGPADGEAGPDRRSLAARIREADLLPGE